MPIPLRRDRRMWYISANKVRDLVEDRMDYEAILLERKGHTAHVTLNRPENLNAYNYEMHRDMNLAWDEINADDDLYTIVVTGAGRAFCSGADMKERSRGQAKGGMGREQTAEPAGQHISNFRHNNTPLGLPRAHHGYPGKPIIAAIHGICCGDGVGWLYRSDFVICASDASFFDPHVNVGAHPTSISNMQTCCARPYALAIHLLGLPWKTDAKRACELGLVTEVVPPEELVERALGLAEDLNRSPNRLAWRTTKAFYFTNFERRFEEARSATWTFETSSSLLAK